jgi:SAM-dependent methyltransferase
MTVVTEASVLVSPDWLALREPADAHARAPELVERLRRHLRKNECPVIYDLGCGTGSMARWLAPQLDSAQHWILYDRDPALLEYAAASAPHVSAAGARITAETRQRDITRLRPADLAGASAITASALLDMLSEDELSRFIASCIEAGCPTLITLSVVGRVDLAPADRLDKTIVEAFNAHQRRTTGGRQLLGPDAVDVAADLLTQHRAEVLVRSSPWRLGSASGPLTREWLIGWVGAAVEQDSELAESATAYLRRRLDDLASGRLDVTVHHRDLLAVPS